MNRQDAEKTITEYLKPIFGFALKKCKNVQDAEDLSQEIVMKAFRALIIRDDVDRTDKFIWTIAHNALSNYYRDSAKIMIGVSIDEVAEMIADPCAEMYPDDNRESIRRLQGEIAYLSKLQRRILIEYYFENRRQADIASELGIPLGTVKWHLFEAKKELKRGMDTMRKSSELKFNPIKFHSYGINGSIGTKSPDEFFRGALAQNICYCVRNTAKTVNEIADDLGVSPVYVESEAEFLEEYGFLLMQSMPSQKDKYIVNFIISEPSTELLVMQNDMYGRAAAVFANELHDELTSSGILDDMDIRCVGDKNFLLWSLIPYIAAACGDTDEGISFEEVATVRPDGAHNIFHASVVSNDIVLPDEYVYMKNMRGPMWNERDGLILWQIDSEWSDRGEFDGLRYSENVKRVLALYEQEKKGRLSKEEYAWLTELGYIKTSGDYDSDFKSEWQIVIIENKELLTKLLAMGKRIMEKHKEEFEALKAPYVKETLKSVPAHMRKAEEYGLQFVFGSDGWFLLHCIVALLKNGKLKEPEADRKKALTTLIVSA